MTAWRALMSAAAMCCLVMQVRTQNRRHGLLWLLALVSLTLLGELP